jgi:hypothetical protein
VAYLLRLLEHSGSETRTASLFISTYEVTTIKMSERQEKERKIAKLERDLRFLKIELERELSREARIQVLAAIRDVEQDILTTLREIVEITRRENANMAKALHNLEKMKKLH